MRVGSPDIVTKVYPTPGIVPQSDRSHRNSGLGYGDLTELTEVPGTVRKCYRTHRSSGIVARAYRTHISYKNDIPVPRVFMALANRTSRSSGYGYECPTELTEVLCRVIPGLNTSGMACTYPTEHDLGSFHPSDRYFTARY